MSRGSAQSPRHAASVSGLGLFFLAFVIASFAYELPLANLSRYDRINPRLLDIATVGLIFYWLFAGRMLGWKVRLKKPIIWPWVWVTFFFGVATAASVLWVPLDKYQYSLFFFAQCIEALAVILIVAAAPVSEDQQKKLLWVALLGGAWVSVYALLQYVGIVSSARRLPTGVVIPMFKQGIYSSLGIGLYHLGMFSVLSCLVGFTVFFCTKKVPARIAAVFLTVLSAIPAMISGSKAGFVGIGFALLLVMLQKAYRRRLGVYILLLIVIIPLAFLFTGSVGRERLVEGSGGTPLQRLMMGFDSLADTYRAHGVKLLIVGGGFYVVPVQIGSYMGSSALRYRIGYGNHNIFLFPLEQAGIGAFVVAIWLWVSVAKAFKRRLKIPGQSEFMTAFASSMRAYFIVLMVVGFGGEVFFLGFGTEHFTVYQLILFILASRA